MGLMSRVRGGVGRWLRGGVADEMAASGGWTWLGGGGPGMGAGREVLRLPAVMCALRNLAEGVGQMPFNLYQVQGEGRRVASEHQVHRVLHRPNPHLTAFRFKEWVLNSCCIYGNFYAEIERDRLGRVMGLWPIMAERVTLAGTMAEPLYKVRVPEVGGGTREVVLGAESVLHLRGYFAGGLLGLSLVKEGTQALETAAAADGYAHKMFSQGMLGGAVLTHPGKLDREAKRRMRESAELAVQGLGNAHRMLVLDEGEQFQQIGINPRDAQALEARQYSVLEVARVFNVPPQRLYDLSRSTYNNAEQMGVEFVVYSLSPWCKRIEEEVDARLLDEGEQGKFFSRFVQAGLLRGDLKSRHDAYKLALEGGWMTVNEVRALEEMNPVEGGDRLRVPLNFGDLGKLGERDRINAEAQRGAEGRREERGQGEGEDGDGPEDDGPGGGGGGDMDGQDGEDKREGAGAAGAAAGEEGKVSREWLEARVVRAAGRLAVRDAWTTRLTADADRVVRGELREVRKIVEAGKRGRVNTETQRAAAGREVRGLAEVLAGLRDYYGEGFKEFVVKMLAPALREFAAAMGAAAAKEAADLVEPGAEWNVENFVEAVVKDIVEGRAGERLAVLERALASQGEDPLGEAEAVLDSWEEQGGEALAETGKNRLGEAVAIAVWASMGVTRKVWKANAGACPFCLRLDGNTAGITETFVERGGALGDGEGGKMVVGHDTMSPPVHNGCSCFVVPG